MEFDGLFEDHELCMSANKGAIGLEYIRQSRHLGENGELKPEIELMLKDAVQLCTKLLRSLSIHKRFEKEGATPPQIDNDFQRAVRFLRAGRVSREFDLSIWPRRARVFQTLIKDVLKGKRTLEDHEIEDQQRFLNTTSSVLLNSINFQQHDFINARGVHRL